MKLILNQKGMEVLREKTDYEVAKEVHQAVNDKANENRNQDYEIGTEGKVFYQGDQIGIIFETVANYVAKSAAVQFVEHEGKGLIDIDYEIDREEKS